MTSRSSCHPSAPTPISLPPLSRPWSGTRSVPSDKVQVTVSKGLVTLKGEVEWQYQKKDARTGGAPDSQESKE